VGPILIAAAILVEESFSSAGVAALTTAGLLFALNPALTIAAQAIRVAHEGDVLR
jgi:hypothetical protein